MITIPKPQADEYPAYADMYFKLVSEEAPLIQHLQDNLQTTVDYIRGLPDDKLTIPCAAGEWTVNEILGHIMDQERVLVYRALRFSRGDETELTTFDHELYVEKSGANQRPLDEMIAEFSSIRQATLNFFGSLNESALVRFGRVGGNRFSVRALVWLTAGHELHHLKSIMQNYG